MHDYDPATRLLRQRRGQHIGRLLLRAHRAFSARAVTKLKERGYDRLSLAHIGLLPHLDEEGTRITTLAERAGMTKQGMGQLVRDLERQGYVTRTPDLADRRAILVCFTDAGRQLLRDAVAVTAKLEAEYEAVLGERVMVDLKAALAALAEPEHRQS
ncbi:MAG: MarR family transcriptional regulator [Chloroflexia bacterium]|nr:MarR family transcriptional regulator [Chloroflexia bacterium]